VEKEKRPDRKNPRGIPKEGEERRRCAEGRTCFPGSTRSKYLRLYPTAREQVLRPAGKRGKASGQSKNLRGGVQGDTEGMAFVAAFISVTKKKTSRETADTVTLKQGRTLYGEYPTHEEEKGLWGARRSQRVKKSKKHRIMVSG